MTTTETTELITPELLARRLNCSVRFIKESSRKSTTLDPIPHIRLNRRTRLYAWGSPELSNWLERRGVGRRKAR